MLEVAPDRVDDGGVAPASDGPQPQQEQRGAQARQAAKLEDAGELIPLARKHLARATGRRGQDSVKLADLFPEPDWHRVSLMRGAECAAWLAMLYDSLAKSPRAGGYNASPADWHKAYEDGIALVREFFVQATTLELAKQSTEWMAARFGETAKTICQRKVMEVLPYWAVMPGQRRAYPLGRMTLRQYQLALWLPKLGWPESDLALKTCMVPFKSKAGWEIGQIKGDGYYPLQANLPDETAAIAACLREARQLLDTVAKLKQRKSSATAERIGPDVRQGKDISAEDIMREFTVRGVQFGDSVPQAERRAWINHLYEALCDLAEVTQLPRRWVGLGGLAIAIGARGVGSAMAHYEPGLRVINFTRMNGAGSLAHEWMRGLDHRFGKRLVNETSLIEANWSNETVNDPFYRGVARTFQGLKDTIRNSEFMQQAWRIEELPRARKSYWASWPELGARSFEAWVEDRLAQMERSSPYLVSGTRVTDHEENPKYSPYPPAAERARLAECYAELAELFKGLEPKKAAARTYPRWGRVPPTPFYVDRAPADSLDRGEPHAKL